MPVFSPEVGDSCLPRWTTPQAALSVWTAGTLANSATGRQLFSGGRRGGIGREIGNLFLGQFHAVGDSWLIRLVKFHDSRQAVQEASEPVALDSWQAACCSMRLAE
jgi:hypothetical protein